MEPSAADVPGPVGPRGRAPEPPPPGPGSPARAPLAAGMGAAVAGAAPLAWLVATGAPGTATAFAAAAVAVGFGVVLAAVALARRGWLGELAALPTDAARAPTTALGARLAGSLQGWEARLRDRVQAQRRARVAAEEADRFESEFLRQLSHELRTPLNAILGFTQVLLDDLDGPLDPAQQESVGAIRASGEVLRELVDDVLDLAALQSGQVSLALAAVDPGPVVEGVARLLRGQVGDRPVSVRWAVDPATPAVAADVRRLRQILVNLGGNAVKFTEAGEVALEVAPAGAGRVCFVVRDTGPGIPPDELRTLFDEFVQASTAGGPRGRQGSGLGLSIVLRLARLQGGAVEVDSAPGRGTCFVVTLPAAGETGP